MCVSESLVIYMQLLISYSQGLNRVNTVFSPLTFIFFY